AEVDDLPHDKEVAGEVEARDHGELVLELRADARRDRPIAITGARLHERAEVPARRLTGRQRKHRAAVAEIGARERAALGNASRPVRLLALVVTADLDVEAAAAEQRAQPVERRPRLGGARVSGTRVDAAIGGARVEAMIHRRRPVDAMIRRRWIVAQDAVRTAGRERDQSRGVLLEIVEAEPALAFRRPQLAGREQAAEIAIPAAVLHEKIHAAAGDRHVGTDARAHARGP